MLWFFGLFLFGMAILARQVRDITEYFDGNLVKDRFVAYTVNNTVIFILIILLIIFL